jgi:hypothetical protein
MKKIWRKVKDFLGHHLIIELAVIGSLNFYRNTADQQHYA